MQVFNFDPYCFDTFHLFVCDQGRSCRSQSLLKFSTEVACQYFSQQQNLFERWSRGSSWGSNFESRVLRNCGRAGKKVHKQHKGCRIKHYIPPARLLGGRQNSLSIFFIERYLRIQNHVHLAGRMPMKTLARRSWKSCRRTAPSKWSRFHLPSAAMRISRCSRCTAAATAAASVGW